MPEGNTNEGRKELAGGRLFFYHASMKNLFRAVGLLSLFSMSALAADNGSTFKITGIDGKPGQAKVRWSEDGVRDIQVTNEKGTEVARISGDGDWTNLGSADDHERKDILRSEDANFDGVNDILVEASSGSAGQAFIIFLADPVKKKYVKADGAEEIWNPAFDRKNKEIVSKPSDGKPTRYKWIAKDRLKKI